jgi:hypothetical protein
MSTRLELQTELEDLLGSRNVYFQPPSNLMMKYPCIRYAGGGVDAKRANDHLYNYTRRYEGVIIDPDPDSEIAFTMLQHFQMCSLGQPYAADNLNHFPFTLYY